MMQEPRKYDIDTIELIKEGWQKSAPVRTMLFGMFMIYVVVSLTLQFVLSLFFPSTVENPNPLNEIIASLISIPILTPLTVGMMTAALRHTRGEAITLHDLFAQYKNTGELSLATLVIYVAIMFGFVLLILPGIYLSIAYLFALLLIADKRMGIWDAMETSRKAVTQHWFKIFFAVIILGFVMLLGFVTFGVGLYWAAPLTFVTLYGLLYRRIFDD